MIEGEQSWISFHLKKKSVNLFAGSKEDREDLGTFFARNLLNGHLISFPKKKKEEEKQFYHLKKNIFINLFSCLQQFVANSIFVTLSFSSFFNIPIYIQFSCSSYIFEINKEKRIKIKNVLNEDNLSSPYALVTCQNVCENEKWKVISSLKRKEDSRQENERKNNFTLSYIYIYIERAN